MSTTKAGPGEAKATSQSSPVLYDYIIFVRLLFEHENGFKMSDPYQNINVLRGWLKRYSQELKIPGEQCL